MKKKESVMVEGMVKGGPYSMAVKYDNLVFVSGQVGFEWSSKALPEKIEEQTLQALLNVEKILENAGSSVEKILKTTVFLRNIEDFEKMNKVYEEFFVSHGTTSDFPARTTVSARLPLETLLIEIEAIAAL